MGFNPHTHEGCDVLNILLIIGNISFNPHTHEGCDADGNKTGDMAFSFNPHTHEGCDISRIEIAYSFFKFQSTHPRRV